MKGIFFIDQNVDGLCDGVQKIVRVGYVIDRAGIDSLVAALSEARPQSAFERAHMNFGVTKREFEIMQEVSAGGSNQEIATKFSISVHTVKHHLGHVFDKIGASTRVELALFVVHHQLVADK